MTIRRVLRTGLPLALVLAIAAGAWLAFTGARAVAAVNDLQSAVDDVRDAVDQADVAALTAASAEAQDAARRANDALDGPVWGALAAIPYVGDTPEVARTTADALATAADGLTPLLEVSDVLDPASLYSDGRIAVERLSSAAEPLALAASDVSLAVDQISSAPQSADGAWVPAGLDAQRAQAQAQLADAAQALTTAAAAADVLPALLGADGPRTWFVGLQSPGEARGTGGVIGTHVILEADDGRLTLKRSASNSELRPLEQLPDFGEQFAARYRGDPAFIANTNLSPHFPYAGRLWQASYAQATGDDVDVVMGTDVVALGSLIEATGPVTLPDGRTLTADEAVDFALLGVYEQFPNSAEREEFQEAVATAVFTAVTEGEVSGQALVRALSDMIAQRRVQLWSPRESEQESLMQLPTSGSVAAFEGPYAYPVLINATASKLDSFIDRSIRYEVGRCDLADRVQSRLELTVTSDIPADADLPDYVIARAERTPDGPVSITQVQIHLSPEAAVDATMVDGEPVVPYAFREQGRPALLITIETRPRTPVTVTVDLNEPASNLDAVVPDQPLARAAGITVIDAPCALTP